jgi:outer membrane lipoprotein carrier protein
LRRLSRLVAALVLGAVLVPGAATGATVADIVSGVQKRYGRIKDIKSDFRQETKIKPGNRVLTARGSAFFKKPKMIRWDFLIPEQQQIITDGQTMWIYEPQEKQVQVYDAGYLDARLRLGFFSDLRRLAEDFQMTAGPEDDRHYQLQLVPKHEGLDVKRITLWVAKKPMRVVRAAFVDLAGNETNLWFANIRENTGLADSMFTFVPPEGTTVIRQPGSAMP